MTTQPEGSKWVGNAGLIIGLPYHKRKSLPRNSKGFEPIEGYFDRTSTESSDSDDDSSETDTEELVRQEREKRIEAEARRRVVEEARSNAAYIMKLVTEQKQAEARQREREAERRKEEERRQRERENLVQAQNKINSVPDNDENVLELARARNSASDQNDEEVEVLDVGSNVEVFALSKSSRSANASEGMYSPDMSVVVQGSPSSAARKSMKLVPSRLSFGAGEGENSSDSEPTNARQKAHKSSKSAVKNLDSTFLTTSHTTETVSLTNDDALIQQADHILATTESSLSFHPGKTSTLLKSVPYKKNGAKKTKKSTKPSKRLLSAIIPLDRVQFSESESERDETLEVILADDAEHFQGLRSHLAKSKMATISDSQSTTTTSNDSAKVVAVEGERSKPRHFAKKSTGNMAGKLAQKKTKTKSRKSVTFVAGSGSETEEEYRGKKRTAKAPPTAVDDIYMSFNDDDFSPPRSLSKKGGKAKKPKKGKEPPPSNDEVQNNTTAVNNNLTTREEMAESGNELSDGVPQTASTVSAVNGSKRAATLVDEEVPANRVKGRRARISETPEHVLTKEPSSPKSVLKNVSRVLNKPTSQQQSQWFVPDMDIYRRKKKKSIASSTTITADSAGVSTSGIDMENDSAELKKRKRGRPRKYVAPPLSDTAPPTVALASSESEVEERNQIEISRVEREPARTMAETSEPQKRKGGRPPKLTSPSKQPIIASASSESELEGDTILNVVARETVEEPPKKKKGRPPKSSRGATLASSESEVEEAEIPPGEVEHGVLEGTVTLESPKKRRGRPRKSAHQATSSESDLEELLDTVRQNRRHKGGAQVGKSDQAPQEKESFQTSMPATDESRLEQQVVESKKSEAKKVRGRSRKSQAVAEQSASSGSEMEGKKIAQEYYDEVQSDEMEQPKSRRGRPRKVIPTEPAASASSESELEEAIEQGQLYVEESQGESGGGESGESAHLEYEGVPVKKSEAKRGRGRLHKSAAPPTSESEENEEEELIKEAKHRGVPPPVHPPPAAPSDGLVTGEEMSQPKKKKKKNKKAKHHQTDGENLNNFVTQGGAVEDEQQPIIEVGDEPQSYDNVGGGNDDYESPASPGTYDDHVDMASNFVQPTTTPGSAGSRGGQQAADLSGAESVDVSVLPRLIKRKRARNNKLVLNPRSKKRKKNKMVDGTVQDPSSLATPDGRGMDPHIYSMSTSGEEGEEDSDHFEGVEIIQSGGGRKYRRLRVEPKKSHTPGVRRSKRTRIAPVRHWENEQLEYNLNTSGAVLKGVLVPVEQEGQGPSRKRPNMAMIPDRQLGPQEDNAFSPYRTTDPMGNTREMAIVHTLASASRIACSGVPVMEDSDADVIIHKLHSSPGTANGVMTFASLGEKPRSSATNFDMYFYVLKGKLLFQVDDQEFALMPNSSINIPEGSVYCIRNAQHTRAEIFFYTHYIGPIQR